MMQSSPRQNVLSKIRSIVSSATAVLALSLVTGSAAMAQAVNPGFLIDNGNFFDNNRWGQSSATPNIGNWQNVWTDSTGFAAGWKWDYGIMGYPAIKGYPSCIVGWSFGNYWKGTNQHGFPVEVWKKPTLPAKWSYTSWGNTNTIYDASFDIWIANQPNAIYPTGEIMVWFNSRGLPPIKNWGQTGSGQVIRDANGVAAPGTYTVYWGNTNDGQGHSWPVWSFVKDGTDNVAFPGSGSWNSPMAPFLNNVATNNQWVWSHYVMGIQAGIEIADSKGQDGGFHTNWGGFWGSAF